MAYGAAQMMLAPEWQTSGYNRVAAVTQAIANSAAGDILIYEMQATGAQGNYGPAEYVGAVWDLTKAATDAGIIIVAAAGNGAENLDSAPYLNYRNRGNSGAIMVGAGDNTINHNKLSFSTYGARVDVHAWGTGVFASGYGDAQQIGGDFNQYYTNFSGTSSATPIVASCAIVLQSYYHSLTGNYMTPVQMRNLLQSTGIPQGTGGNIGPIPNMQAAILQVQSEFLSVDEVSGLEFIVYPNPATDRLTIKTKDLSAGARVEICNAVGQRVYGAAISEDNAIDLSSFSQGLYFVKVVDGNRSETKKIIKK
ncbi:Alkaline elastase YaB precursor [compost metagenome]